MCGRVRWLASFRPGVHLRPGGRDLLTPLRWSVVGERKATAACSVSLSVTECLWQAAEPEGESRASDPALWLLSSAFSGHSRRKQTVGSSDQSWGQCRGWDSASQQTRKRSWPENTQNPGCFLVCWPWRDLDDLCLSQGGWGLAAPRS